MAEIVTSAKRNTFLMSQVYFANVALGSQSLAPLIWLELQGMVPTKVFKKRSHWFLF